MSKKNKIDTLIEETAEVKARFIKPKNQAQREYIETMEEFDVTLCRGPSGTGKTACALKVAADELVNDKVNRIIVSRPTVETGRGLGFHPGSLDEKYRPYTTPVYEELKKTFGRESLDDLIENYKVVFMPLEYLRGITFSGSFVLLDEAQNATFEQLKMFLTRLGSGCKMVIDGDEEQSDLKNRDYDCDFIQVYDALYDVEEIGTFEFQEKDIVRHPLVSTVLKRLRDI